MMAEGKYGAHALVGSNLVVFKFRSKCHSSKIKVPIMVHYPHLLEVMFLRKFLLPNSPDLPGWSCSVLAVLAKASIIHSKSSIVRSYLIC